jgi:adenylyltransferase/sulfurtransferase
MEKEKYEWGEGVFTLLSWFKKDRVKNARVLVAGCGALGNEVVKNLALFGVGHIYVVDFDKIELSNLTRSVLFREEDAYNHAFKAEIVAKRASEINPQIEVIPIVGNLFSDVGFGLYRSVDVVIGCLDSRIARYQLNRLCMRAGKSWIDGSIENLTGAVKVYVPGVNCYECSLSRDEFNHIMLRTGCADVVRSQTAKGRVATTPISASIVGALQVQEAMKIIHLQNPEEDEDKDVTPFKTLQGRMLRYEGMTNVMNIYKISSWKNTCAAHEQWTDVIAAEDLSASQTVEQVLAALKMILNVENVEINMCNNKFIDVIATDYPQKEFEVMLPESKLDNYIKKDKELRQLSYRTLIHKHFYENIDNSFPYQSMTLQQIGIPAYDVLQVSTENGVFFVELSADRY